MASRITDIFAGKIALGSTVRIEGWVRTRRDSKAGLSFIQVSDGSTLAPLQIVATRELANYEDEVLHCTSGVAVACTGTLVESRGRGQSVEVQADSVQVLGWV